jgi:conserved oligomeric Golgi complex subunit 6
VLREILSVHGSTLADESEDEVAEQSSGFNRVLDATVDPAVEMCTTAAEQKHRVRPAWDAPVFILNCLSYLKVQLLRLSERKRY